MNLGYIDFLNCYPFYYHMFEKEPVPDVEVFPDYPGRLNTMLAEGRLDMSPISSAACAGIADEILVLPQFCLSSVGYIGSVTLISRYPIEDLDGRTVGVTSASHTSAVLMKILLKNHYGADPVYITTGPRPSLDNREAALLIGNDAMVRAASPAPYMYDMGDLWLRKTGYPVVFAVFAVRRAALERHEDSIRAVIDSYQHSLACLRSERDTVIAGARNKYPDILYDVGGYYDLFRFDFTDELKAAAMFYFEQAGALGLLPPLRKLEFLTYK
ncbi:MAG: menaquinone biosynthesis protein [Thermodesulfobacteriota bacterium]|nr:menaquinone biosynthesis protein [Thermodesulfobacteriota bacterium]